MWTSANLILNIKRLICKVIGHKEKIETAQESYYFPPYVICTCERCGKILWYHICEDGEQIT